MDQLLSERNPVSRELRRIIDELAEGPWGIRVGRVESKDVSLPDAMKWSMSRQAGAEAERERRARIITADGEYQASKRLAAAANVMARDPAALQLRLLQAVVEVASERNSALVMPVPVELLRFFDKMTPAGPGAGLSPSLADFGDAEVAKAEAAIEGRPPAAGPPDAIPPVEAPDMCLDLVAVAAAVFLLRHVADCGQVGDDAVGAALGDARAGRDVAQPHALVVGDAQQAPGMAGREIPALHLS